MSEENAPKLRLKPKLAADPSPPPPSRPSPPPPPPSASEVPVQDAPQVRLKPRLTPPRVGEINPGPADFPPPKAPPTPVAEPTSVAEPREEPESFPKVSLKPKALTAPPPPGFRPPTVDTPPPLLFEEPAPETTPLEMPLPPENPERSESRPAEIPTNLTARPFPPPPANFPPPEAKPRPPWAHVTVSRSTVSRKKAAFVAALVVLSVVGGGFFAYLKFSRPSRPYSAVASELTPAPESSPTDAEKIAADEAAAASTAAKAAVPEVVPVVEVPVVIPPPVATAEFKLWVTNLKIGGVRTGTTTRVFIGGTAYAIGDVIDPEAGIILDAYNPETRMLTFKDQGGATVDRRN